MSPEKYRSRSKHKNREQKGTWTGARAADQGAAPANAGNAARSQTTLQPPPQKERGKTANQQARALDSTEQGRTAEEEIRISQGNKT